MIRVDLSGARDFFDAAGPDFAAASAAHRALTEGGEWSDRSGFLTLPARMHGESLRAIQAAAERIRSHSEVLVVIGAGGSYLGARAAIELLSPPGYPALRGDNPRVLFAGHSLSPRELRGLVDQVGERDFSVNVISKSGSTLEPALAFRVFRLLAEKKYGAAARRHIYVTTSPAGGALAGEADAAGYERFAIPEDVGGRYSVLSPVGLLPMAVAGLDVKILIAAAREALHELDLRSADNPAWQYAAARQHLYSRGRAIELLASFEPAARYLAEWWKQLFGESEGKNGVGIFPASVDYTADLHSMGQYIQDGPRTLFETVLSFDDEGNGFTVPFALGDPDGLNYLAGKELGEIRDKAARAVRAAYDQSLAG